MCQKLIEMDVQSPDILLQFSSAELFSSKIVTTGFFHKLATLGSKMKP